MPWQIVCARPRLVREGYGEDDNVLVGTPRASDAASHILTTSLIHLPHKPPQTEHPHLMTTKKINGYPFTILLIEDNPAHAELVMRSFEDHRVTNTIIHLSDGKAALDYLFQRGRYANEQKSPRPHVILLDLRLPLVDGLDVLKEIKSSDTLRSIPVVILTTSSAEKDVFESYNLHANCYVTKPVDLDEFIEAIRKIEDFWLMIVKLPRVAV